jgi:chromate reductase
MSTPQVAVIVGSLARASINRRVAQALATMAAPRLELGLVEIGDLPLYNPDLDEAVPVPAAWQRFRDDLRASDAVLFVTPEYNRSVPAALKNAIDVGSRPYGHSVWNGKPAAIVSVSPGALAAFGANHHLRQSLTFLNMPTMQQPEAYIGGAGQLFAPDGQVAEASTRAFLEGFVAAFDAWIRRFAAT